MVLLQGAFRQGVGIVLLVLLVSIGLAQESGTTTRKEAKADQVVVALEKIQKDFSQHIEKEAKMQEEYRYLETKLKKTEEDLQRINAEGMKQQLAAMQTAMQSMQLNANLQFLASGNAGGNSNNANNSVRDFAQMQLMQNRLLQNLDSTLRANQLQQLDANAQATVRKRIETIQEAVKMQQAWMDWQNELAMFYTRYWPLSDPEGRLNMEEIEESLAVLENRHDKDVAAQLAAANLLVRAQRHSEALGLVDELLELQTPLQGVAMMEKSKILSLLDKDKEAKQALQAAIKLDKSNPYARWIRAEIAMAEDQVSIAETEWRFLTTIKPMEIQARRSLAILYAKRSKKTPGDGVKAIKEASTAMELDTSPDWYSHYVMAVASDAGRKPESARESIDKAEAMAEGESKERCLKFKERLEGGKQ